MDTGNNIQNLVSKNVEPRVKKRSAWAAFFFTLLCPGLGHFYSGEIKKGFKLFLISFVIVSVFTFLFNITPNIYLVVIGFLVILGFSLYIIIDSIITAKKKKEYVLKVFNKPFFYIWIIVTNFYYFGPVEEIFFPNSYTTPTGSMQNTILLGDRFFGNNFAYGIRNPFTGKYLFLYNTPQRGDVVDFKFPGMPDKGNNNENIHYLKRILAVPGDSLVIKYRLIFINGEIFELPSTSILLERSTPFRKEPDPMIFPKGFKWYVDNYGPIKIPKAGVTVKFDTSDIRLWSRIIEDEDNKLEIINNRIFINDIEKYSYTFKNNYYFMIGDNWYNSLDSRFWGFVPESDIISKITMIIFSIDETSLKTDIVNINNSIRWNRIGQIVK